MANDSCHSMANDSWLDTMSHLLTATDGLWDTVCGSPLYAESGAALLPKTTVVSQESLGVFPLGMFLTIV